MFISAWNEFMYALIMTTKQDIQPVTVAIANLTGKYGVRFDLMTAAAVLYVIPVVTITIIFQKNIIGGLTAGAVKG
jgi:multiple sugar transport system permease protein